MTTRSGQHRIFNLEERWPLAEIPGDFILAIESGVWFFEPTAEGWDRSEISRRRGKPMAFSIGFATAEESLAEAERWEAERESREARWDANQRLIEGL